MAGDWIKMRTNLWTDGRVRLLARLLNCNVATVTGVTFRLWSIADQHSIDGVLNGYDAAAVDAEVGVAGAAAALADERIGWLIIEPDRVVIPRFNEHNGESAKRRAQENARVRAWRKAQKCNGSGNASAVSKPVTREEKRREEKNILIRESHNAKSANADIDDAQKPKRAERIFISDKDWANLLTAPDLADGNEVLLKAEVLKASDWTLSKGKRHKDGAAFMRNWLRRARANGRRGGSSNFEKNMALLAKVKKEEGGND